MSEQEAVLQGIAGAMPEAQEHVIGEAAAEAEAAAAASTSAPASAVDRNGRGFDPNLHETDGNGAAVLNKDRTLRLKRGRGAERARLRPEDGPSTIKTPAMASLEPTATKTGHLIAEQIFGVGRMLGGEEWAPQLNPELGLDERAQMRDAWATYCEHKEIRDIPPGMALSMVMLAYISPRLFMPKTKSRLQVAKEWVLVNAIKWRLWRPKRDARINSGDDGKREDDASEATG